MPGNFGSGSKIFSFANFHLLFFIKKSKLQKEIFCFAYIFQLWQNIGGNKFSALGVSPKWVKSKKRRKKRKRKREREKERLKNGDNNGQATHGARKHAWRTQAAWAKREQYFTHGRFPEVGQKQKTERKKEKEKKKDQCLRDCRWPRRP